VEEIKAPIACNQIEYHVMLDQTKVKTYLAFEIDPAGRLCPLAQAAPRPMKPCWRSARSTTPARRKSR